MRKFVLFIPLIFVLCSHAGADISLPREFQDHMVFQRGEEIVVWGNADPGEMVEVSFGTKLVYTLTDPKGDWELRFPPLDAGGPHTVIVKGSKNNIILKDIYVGDVWVFSGQSNMQVSFQYYLDIKEIDEKYNRRFREDLKNCAEDKLVRNYMVATKDDKREVVRNSAENRWFMSNPEDVKECNPIAYYFVREVSRKTGVMTAAIRIAWGGQRIEPFYQGAIVYEHMLKPWSKFKIKGIVWYQGESNLHKDGDRFAYALKLQLMIRDLRKLWGDPGLPFLIVQMPPSTYSSQPFNNEESLSVFLEAQRQALAIPYTSMAVTSDLGMANGLHQPQKYEVAVRLANLAFANVYDFYDAVPAGPQFKDIEVRGSKIVVNFETFGSKLTTTDGEAPMFFEIFAAGRNSKGFLPAQAMIDGNSVVVWNEEVERPYDVRFAFGESDLMKINLTNSEGIPAAVFWARAANQLHPGILMEMKEEADK